MIVHHRLGEYPIHFIDRATLNHRIADQIVITDQNVSTSLGLSGANTLSLTPGESSKSLTTYARVVDWLIERGVGRKTKVFAVGGGVIGDLVGFVASTYMRGISYTQVPTSLLSQVDSSVGGKVGIDHGKGKNLLGSFYPPVEVLVSREVLSHLPDRQIKNGLGEVLKYGFISNPELFGQLEPGVLPSEEVIRTCIQAKIDVVEADEFETNGVRATLNFGHTVAHALEACLNYEGLLHGEAVAVGMAVETFIGTRLGVTPAFLQDQVRSQLSRHGLPDRHELLADPDFLLEAMRRDKKRTREGIPFSFLTDMGKCKLYEGIAEDDVVRLIKSYGEAIG